MKEKYNLKRVVYKIKLDKSENDFMIFSEDENWIIEKATDKNSSAIEWNQEYEIIYKSYVLEN